MVRGNKRVRLMPRKSPLLGLPESLESLLVNLVCGCSWEWVELLLVCKGFLALGRATLVGQSGITGSSALLSQPYRAPLIVGDPEPLPVHVNRWLVEGPRGAEAFCGGYQGFPKPLSLKICYVASRRYALVPPEGRLDALRSLQLSCGYYTPADLIESCPALESLKLDHFHDSSVGVLVGLRALTELDVSCQPHESLTPDGVLDVLKLVGGGLRRLTVRGGFHASGVSMVLGPGRLKVVTQQCQSLRYLRLTGVDMCKLFVGDQSDLFAGTWGDAGDTLSKSSLSVLVLDDVRLVAAFLLKLAASKTLQELQLLNVVDLADHLLGCLLGGKLASILSVLEVRQGPNCLVTADGYAGMERCRKLRRLSICVPGKTIGVKSRDSLAGCTALQRLSVTVVRVGGLQAAFISPSRVTPVVGTLEAVAFIVRDLRHLRELWVDAAFQSSDTMWQGIAASVSLCKLVVQVQSVTRRDLNALAGSKSLKSLKLQGAVLGVGALRGLQNSGLESLTVYCSLDEAAGRDLALNTTLTTLTLRGCESKQGMYRWPAMISSMHGLRTLCFESCYNFRGSDLWWINNTSLERLHFKYCGFVCDDVILCALVVRLPSLTWISFQSDSTNVNAVSLLKQKYQSRHE